MKKSLLFTAALCAAVIASISTFVHAATAPTSGSFNQVVIACIPTSVASAQGGDQFMRDNAGAIYKETTIRNNTTPYSCYVRLKNNTAVNGTGTFTCNLDARAPLSGYSLTKPSLYAGSVCGINYGTAAAAVQGPFLNFSSVGQYFDDIQSAASLLNQP